MIFITGDIHGDPTRFSMESFPEQKEMTKDDYVIILGDFGLVWNCGIESKEEKYWLKWLEEKPFSTLFIDGNHENHDRLDAYPIEIWKGGKVHFIRPSVIHLMRGQVFHIDDLSFFTFGGARSHDISAGILDPEDPDFRKKKRMLDRDHVFYRVKRRSWWEREMPSEEEMQEGIVNLKKEGNKVDYILTHCTYNALLPQLDGGSGTYERDYLSDYFQTIKQTVDFKHWLFGHFHMNKTFHWERASCLYEQIIRIA